MKLITAVLLLLAGCSNVTDSLKESDAPVRDVGNGFKRTVIDGKDCLIHENGDSDYENYSFAFDCDWHPR